MVTWARAADGARSRTASASQARKPSPPCLRPSPRHGHRIMGKKTTKKSETDAEGRKKMVEAAVDLLQGKYADLPGNDQKKCRDEALLEDVRVKMGWDYPPGGAFLFDEVRDHRERADHEGPVRV